MVQSIDGTHIRAAGHPIFQLNAFSVSFSDRFANATCRRRQNLALWFSSEEVAADAVHGAPRLLARQGAAPTGVVYLDHQQLRRLGK